MTNAITPIVGTAAADKLSCGSTGDDTLHGGGGPALVDMTKRTIAEDGAGNRITLARLPENPNQCSRVARPARSSQTTEMDGVPVPYPSYIHPRGVMAMIRLTRDQVKARILMELDSLDSPIEARCLDVEGSGKNWKTVYRPESPRIDEVQFAALYEARQRMAAAGLVLC